MKNLAACTGALVGATLLALPALALADEAAPPAASPGANPFATGWYGAIGFARNSGHGPDDSAITALAGWRFQPNLALEVELTDGLRDGGRPRPPASADPDPNHHDRGRMSFSAAAYGVAYLPVTPQLQLLARLGVGQTQFSGDPAHPGRLDLTSLNMGVGAVYNLNEANALRVDFTRKAYDHHGDDSDVGVSFVHRF